jgi:hypothetical protein
MYNFQSLVAGLYLQFVRVQQLRENDHSEITSLDTYLTAKWLPEEIFTSFKLKYSVNEHA